MSTVTVVGWIYSSEYDERNTRFRIETAQYALDVGVTIPNSGPCAGQISQLTIHGSSLTPITNAVLREIPIGRLHALATATDVASTSAGRLTPPGRGRKAGDDFYRKVAERYLYLARTTRVIAPRIAAEASVPVGTARRWILEARRIGFLPSSGERSPSGHP